MDAIEPHDQVLVGDTNTTLVLNASARELLACWLERGINATKTSDEVQDEQSSDLWLNELLADLYD